MEKRMTGFKKLLSHPSVKGLLGEMVDPRAGKIQRMKYYML